MGTEFQIHVYAKDAGHAGKAIQAALARIDAIHALASDYLPESELSKLNRAPAQQAVPLSDDLFFLIKRALEISALTEGAFDITAVYAVQNWRRSRRQKKLPSPEQTAKAVAMTGWRLLQLDAENRTLTKLKPGLQLDLGGIAKGYAADAALAVLREQGCPRALVAASGDLAIGNAPPGETGWLVSLKTFTSEKTDLKLRLSNCACSTSGDLHQYVEMDGQRWSHIVDPATGLGLTQQIACSVIAPDTATSDALATAACVLGEVRSIQLLAGQRGLSFRLVLLQEDDRLRIIEHGHMREQIQ